MKNFEPHPIYRQYQVCSQSRESKWLSPYRDTHYTLTQLCRKYDISKESMISILPRPDLRSPYGNRTRLWEKESVIKFLGDAK